MPEQDAVPGAIPPSGEGQAESSEQGTQASTGSAPANWYNDPKFREMQAERDRREAALIAERDQLKAEQRRLYLESLEPEERTAEETRELKERNAALERAIYERDIKEAKARVLAEIHAETGIPLDVLEETQSKAAAQKVAKSIRAYVDAEVERRIKEREERHERNAPGYMGGSGGGARSNVDPDLARALEEKDAVALTRTLIKVRKT